MTKKVFLFKEINLDDRDCVKYIETGRLGSLECNHYFPGVNLVGACFSMGMKNIAYKDIETVLTENEFIKLKEYDEKISELGYGIEKNDDRYDKGIELYKEIEEVINKLLSNENEKLFNKIVEDEKQYLKDEYNLSDDDVECIFNEYGLSYKDRGIVGMVFNDIEEASYEEAENLGYVDENNERWFDYEKFGDDMLEEDQYLELPSGKIAYLNY